MSLPLSRFLALSVLAAAAHAQSAYTVVDLGTLGGARSTAWALNNNDHVVGASATATGETHAFIFRDGTLQDLGTFAGGAGSTAMAINDSDVVAGSSARASGANHAFIWTAGALTDIGALDQPPFDASFATAINNQGEVAGTATVNRIGRPVNHGFIFANGAMRDVGTPAAATTEPAFAPRAMNAGGEIVGASVNSDGLGGALALYGNGGVSWVDLPPALGATSGAATGINAGGAIVGFYTTADHTRSFVEVNGAVSDLGVLDGFSEMQADSINGAGDVVGRATNLTTGESTAFLYHDGRLYDLSQQASNASGTFTVLNEATAINDRGDITGFGMTASGATHGFLLLRGAAGNGNATIPTNNDSVGVFD